MPDPQDRLVPRLGRVEHPWGCALTGFGRPFGLCVDTEGRLLVTDMDLHRVFRFDRAIRRYQSTGGSGWTAMVELADHPRLPATPCAPAGLNGPHSVDFDGGHLVVCCYYAAALVVLDEAGVSADTWLAGLLQGPATARFAAGRLLIAEYAANAVIAASPDGGYLGRIGRGAVGRPFTFERGTGALPPSAEPGGFDRPHMALGIAGGDILVADTWNHRIQRFTAGGEWRGWIGAGAEGWSDRRTSPAAAASDNGFHAPVAVDLRDDGVILVTDWGNDRLLLFDGEGRALGPLVTPLPLRRPYDARFFGDGYAVADSHHGRVLVVDRAA